MFVYHSVQIVKATPIPRQMAGRNLAQYKSFSGCPYLLLHSQNKSRLSQARYQMAHQNLDMCQPQSFGIIIKDCLEKSHFS